MKSHWFRLFAIVGIGLCGATADAANLKIYPGAVCQQSSNNGQRALDRGSVRNQDPGFEMTVLCPFVRDESAGVSSAVVRVFDRNPSVAVDCTIFSESVNGSQFWWSSERHDSGTTFNQTNAFDMNYTTVTGGDYLYATCVLPRATNNPTKYSHIVQWWVTET